MKEIIKLILFGFGIIGYLVAYGTNYPLAMAGVMLAFEGGMIDENIYNFFLYGYPIIGISFFIGIVLYVVFNMGKKHTCSKCNMVVKWTKNGLALRYLC